MPPADHLPSEKLTFQLSLRRRGISDRTVLRAMEEVPRDLFVEAHDRDAAWRDTALGIACGQTISQPFVVAYMTEQLALRSNHRVLEIGTGSGYQAAILSRLCGSVLTVERFRTLADRARQRLEQIECHNVEVMLADGLNLAAGIGPFDRISAAPGRVSCRWSNATRHLAWSRIPSAPASGQPQSPPAKQPPPASPSPSSPPSAATPALPLPHH